MYRKIGLCYIRLHDYERARKRMAACPGDESLTHYMKYFIYVQQGPYYEF